jgi:hypothetical protein
MLERTLRLRLKEKPVGLALLLSIAEKRAHHLGVGVKPAVRSPMRTFALVIADERPSANQPQC